MRNYKPQPFRVREGFRAPERPAFAFGSAFEHPNALLLRSGEFSKPRTPYFCVREHFRAPEGLTFAFGNAFEAPNALLLCSGMLPKHRTPYFCVRQGFRSPERLAFSFGNAPKAPNALFFAFGSTFEHPNALLTSFLRKLARGWLLPFLVIIKKIIAMMPIIR